MNTLINFCSGSLNTSDTPHPILSTVWQKSLQSIQTNGLLQYQNPHGNTELKNTLISKIQGNETHNQYDAIITPSATNSLYILLSKFAKSTKTNKNVYLQIPSYFGIPRQLHDLNIPIHTWETIEDLEKLYTNNSEGLVYVNSNYHSIHGQCLSDEDKKYISQLQKEKNATIIEDNASDLLYFDESHPPTKLIQSVRNGIYYVSSAAKILGPRLPGYIVGNKQDIQKIKSKNITVNLGASILDQLIVLNALEQNYLPKLRKHHREKWEYFKAVLMQYGLTDFKNVEGGIFVKLNTPKHLCIEKLVSDAKKCGIIIEENKYYYPDKKNRPYIRLNFVKNSHEDNALGIEKLSQIFDPAFEGKAFEQNPYQQEKLHWVNTGGGTTTPIDKVRCITNNSKGTSANLLTQELIHTYKHTVSHLISETAKPLYNSSYKIKTNDQLKKQIHILENETQNLQEILLHIRRNSDVYKKIQKKQILTQKQIYTLSQALDSLSITQFSDFWDYRNKLLTEIRNPKTDIVVLGAAVSDYGYNQEYNIPEKIRSNKDTLELSFTKLPKIIGEIKNTRKNIFLVGYKLLTDNSEDTLISEAYKSVLTNGCDIVVANTVSKIGSKTHFSTFLVTKEKGIIPIPNRNNLPQVLIETVESRFSKKHCSTKSFEKVKSLPLPSQEIQTFLHTLQDLSKFSLFSPYLENSENPKWNNAEFGFVAKRTSKGTLITGRGSNKSQAQINDIALVTKMDQESHALSVVSTEKKASLNANIAHNIFHNRPEIQYIVHSHIKLPLATKAQKETTPGTVEDWKAIEDLVCRGENIIYQKNHGVLILLKNIEELIPILQQNKIYKNTSEFYDIAYHRFQYDKNNIKRESFAHLIENEIHKNDKLLDMCGGTGELSKQLLERGFSHITLADCENNMMNIARKRLQNYPDVQFENINMETMNTQNTFDAIVIRQAINYITPQNIESTFKNIKQCLHTGGKIIFNTFEFSPQKPFIKRNNRFETQEHIILTREDNFIQNSTIHHSQQTDIFYKKTGQYKNVYDFNTFYGYTRKEFEKALKNSGFHNIRVFQKGSSLTIVAET